MSIEYWELLYIQLSFSVYLTCKWKGAVSYDTARLMWKPISWTDSLCLYSQRKTQPTFRIRAPVHMPAWRVSPSHQMVSRNCWETWNQTRPLDQIWSRLGFWSSCLQKLLQPWRLCSSQVSTVDECRETGQWLMLSPFLRRVTKAQHPTTDRYHSPPSVQK